MPKPEAVLLKTGFSWYINFTAYFAVKLQLFRRKSDFSGELKSDEVIGMGFRFLKAINIRIINIQSFFKFIS
jgi:hypothetical protein